MSKKIKPEEFLNRFYRNFPEAKIELLNYTAISKPLTVKCCQCGKQFTKQRAREFLAHYDCCGSRHNIQRVEKLINYYNQCKDYSYVKAIDCDNIIIKHNSCGNEFRRTINAAMDNPESCPYCHTISTLQQLTLQQAQTQIDTKFNGQIKILDYKGQTVKNHYKCLKCGFIFTQKQVCLMQSKGCPKCDCHKSNGERQLKFKASSITNREFSPNPSK